MKKNSEPVKPGYKMTSLGVIPEDWEVKRFETVADIDKNNLSTNTQVDYEFRYISLSDVDSKVAKIDTTFQIFRSAPSRARRIVKRGDVLMSTVRPTLQGFTLIKEDDENLIASTGFAVISANSCVSEYLYQYLFCTTLQKQVYQLLLGSNYPAINSSDVKKLKIPLPPLSEQKAIAEVLSTWDEAIEKTQELIEQKELRKKALMQQLLTGKKRLRGFSGEWEHKKLGEVAVLKIGKTPSRSNEAYWNNPNPQNVWISISDMKNVILMRSKEYLSNLALEECKINKVTKGTLLMSFKLTLGKIAWAGCDLFTNEAIVAIYPQKTKVTDKLLFYILPQAVEKSDAGQAVKGKTLNQEHLQNLAFKIPKLAEQKAIADVLQKADEEIKLEKQKLEQLKLQKKALMQILLTGKKRAINLTTDLKK